MSVSIQEAAFDALPAPMLVVDAGGGILAGNRAWRARVAAGGGPADGMVGQPYAEACRSILGLDPQVPALAALIEGRTDAAVVEYPGSAAGKPRWLSLTAVRMESAEGRRLLIHDDKAEPPETEALRQVVIENSTDLAFLLRRDATIAFVSPSIRELLGHAPGEMLGRIGFELVHPDDMALAADAFARGIAKPGSSTAVLTIRLRHRDGAWCPFDIQGRSLTEDVMGGSILISARDATARTRAEAEAERAHTLLQSVFDNSPLALLLCGADDRIMLANREFREGYPGHAPFLQAGAGFEDLVRAVAEAGQAAHAATPAEVEMFIAQRLVAHQIADGTPFLRELPEGRRVQVFEKRLPGGETLTVGVDVTAIIAATEAAAASELRFRVTFDQAPIGMSLTRPDASLMRVNKSLCDFLGYTEEELLALNYRQLTVPDDVESQAFDLQRLRNGEIPMVRREKRYLRKDGASASADLAISCVRKPDGTPDYYISIIQDIRQHKAAEEAVRRREQQLRLVADNVPMVIIYYDHELRYNFANQTTAAWYGMPLDRIVGRKIADVLPPATYERLKPRILEALAGKHLRLTDRVRYPDGRERQVEFIYQPHLAEDGRVLGAIVVVSDIGERLDMLEALQRRESELRTIAEHFPGLIAYTDAGLTLRFINRIGASWYGRRAEEMIDKPVQTYLPADHAEPYRRLLEHVLRGNPLHEEMSFTYPNGETRQVELMHMPDQTGEGSIRGVFTFVFDLTERRQVEEQLRQIQKMEAVGQLTGGVAHDFNNLLGVIVGNLDLLARELEANPRAQAWAERAIAAAERGAALTQRLLAFSRRQALRPQPVDANRLIAESVVLLRRTLGEAISIVTHPAETLWSCMVDAPQLDSALLNLAINARDAMPGGGRISIETANAVLDQDYAAHNSEVAAGDYVCITVSDTGTGMSPDVAARAFDPFFTTKPVGKGTGLGLSMVYGFVKQSGGHIRLYSEPGHGTSIKLYLPRTPAERIAGETADAGAGALPMGKGELILLVEDNPSMLEFASNALETLGYRVLAARDAAEARRLLDSRRDIALLFSDVMLPGGSSGFDLAAAAREGRPALPVLLTSGFSEKSMADSGHPEIAGVDILPKPYRIRELGLKLREVFRAEG